MKKNILFIMPSLSIGGGEKSLINLLSQLDYSRYNVDLFLIKKEGVFLHFIPKEVHILDIPENLELFKLPIYKSILAFMKKGSIKLAFDRIMFFIKNRFKENVSKGEQYSWKYMSRAIGKLDKQYDVSIGYLEKTANYLCVDCVQAKKKIGWIHTDYSKLEADKNFDREYFRKLDYIITVSEECSEVLIENFNEEKHKVKIIKNIISPKSISKMSLENIDIEKKNNENIIVSVGRLSYEKGFDIAVKACKIIKDKGLDIKWYLIGEGRERKNLEKLIDDNQLQDSFILVGADPNPYKYLAKADIYVQPSRFEGKSIAMDEAKILHKPIVATDFSTVNDQVTNKVDGIISEMNEISLAENIKLLIGDSILNNKIITNLKNIELGTEDEIFKLYKLLN